jgi:hypothetical protein
MLRLLADENFNGDIVRGLLLREPDLDLVRVQDVGLAGEDDPDVLAWAAENDRIILSHDRATLPGYAYARVAAGQEMAGVFILNDRFPVGHAIEEILLLIACTEQAEWSGRAVYVPRYRCRNEMVLSNRIRARGRGCWRRLWSRANQGLRQREARRD